MRQYDDIHRVDEQMQQQMDTDGPQPQPSRQVDDTVQTKSIVAFGFGALTLSSGFKMAFAALRQGLGSQSALNKVILAMDNLAQDLTTYTMSIPDDERVQLKPGTVEYETVSAANDNTPMMQAWPHDAIIDGDENGWSPPYDGFEDGMRRFAAGPNPRESR